MIWKKQDILPFALEDGIVMDYYQNRFVILLQDEKWSEYECQALYQKPVHIYFVYERICALFLFENVDAIDTSDAVFDIHACEEADALLQQDQYTIEVYLIDQKQTVCAARSFTIAQAESRIIRSYLQQQMDTPYEEEGFQKAYEKVSFAFEPFELEERAICKMQF